MKGKREATVPFLAIALSVDSGGGGAAAFRVLETRDAGERVKMGFWKFRGSESP